MLKYFITYKNFNKIHKTKALFKNTFYGIIDTVFKTLQKLRRFFMKFKKLWHVIVFCLSVMLLFFAVSYALSFLENKIFSGIKVTNPYFLMTINGLMMSFVGVLILKKLGKINILKKGKGFWQGALLGSIMLCPNICSAFYCISYMFSQDPKLHPISVIITIVCMFIISAGILEELIYRGIILGAIDDYFGHKSASDVWKTVVLSGIFFGIFHFGNLRNGVSFLPVLSQVIDAVGIGIFWGAVYIRSRNIYSIMFLHAASDILAATWLFIEGNSSWGSLSSSRIDFISSFIMLIIHILLAIFLLRKKKMKEIINPDSDKLCL